MKKFNEMKNIKLKKMMKQQHGFTIMELLVAVSIGVFLLGSMSKLFFNSKSTITTQSNVSKIEEDSRFTLFLMENDIAAAGFRGCSSGIIKTDNGTNFYNVAGTSDYYNKTAFIEGSQGNGTSFSPGLNAAVSGLSPAPDPSMDVLTIRTATGEPSLLSTDMVAATTPLTVTSLNVTPNNNALITNCFSSSLFKVSTAIGSVVTPTAGLGAIYAAGAQIYPYVTTTYYVGTDKTLYKTTNNGTPDPIAYNVERFAILYGINTDNTTTNVNRYVFAPSVTDFTKVYAVRIGIAFKGADNNTVGTAKAAYSYQFNGTTYTPNDGKLRKVYYTTVTLRNMLP